MSEKEFVLANHQIIAIVPILQALNPTSLPIGLAWDITLTLQALSPMLPVYSSHYDRIKEKYALRHKVDEGVGAIVLGRDAEGAEVPGTFQVLTELTPAFLADLEVLNSQTTTFLNVGIKIADFPKDFCLEPEKLQALSPIIIR
jgi:hypothetical protein